MSPRGIRLTAYAATDVGRVRQGNEDSYFVGHTVFAVADGMGGHVAGEVASRKALEPIAELDGEHFASEHDAQEALVDAITQANAAVVAEGDADPDLQGMGTTLTAVIVRNGKLHLAHVGDSRAYLLRDGEPISQLTTDHTLVEQLVRDGRLSREQAATHPQRSVVTRAIGVERSVKVDSLPPIELQSGDQVLLCSDGLTGPVDDARITELLDPEAHGDEIARRLVAAANEAGGPDNITVVLLRTTGAPRQAAAPGDSPDAEATGVIEDPAAVDHARAREQARPIRTRSEGQTQEDWAERMGRYGQQQGAEGTGIKPRRRGRLAAVMLAVVLLLGVLAGGGYALLSRAYFVGDNDGEITIFNGVPQSVAGVPLHWVVEESGLETDALPTFRAEQVRNRPPTAANLTEAREIVARYGQLIEDAEPDPEPTPEPTPTPTPEGGAGS